MKIKRFFKTWLCGSFAWRVWWPILNPYWLIRENSSIFFRNFTFGVMRPISGKLVQIYLEIGLCHDRNSVNIFYDLSLFIGWVFQKSVSMMAQYPWIGDRMSCPVQRSRRWPDFEKQNWKGIHKFLMDEFSSNMV